MRLTLPRIFTIIFCLLIIAPVESVSLLDGGGIKNSTVNMGPRGFLDSLKARTVGDVVTVKIVENAQAVKKAEVTLNNDTRADNNLIFQMAMTATSTLTPATNDVANMITNFGLPVDYSRRNLREISVNNKEQFTALISCLVVEIDPESGNMVVEGSRQILMEGETKSMYVRGVVFPKDIDSNNEVPSYKLANAQIQIIGSGSLSKDRDNGLLPKIFRKLF